MCQLCYASSSAWLPRRGFLLAAGAAAAGPALAQVSVGQPSSLRGLVPAAELESAATRTRWHRTAIHSCFGCGPLPTG